MIIISLSLAVYGYLVTFKSNNLPDELYSCWVALFDYPVNIMPKIYIGGQGWLPWGCQHRNLRADTKGNP